MFKKVLIANRGEIAVRIIKACQEMGIKTVAVYSEADRKSPHVELADETINLGDPAPSESYLNIAKIIKNATDVKAEAIHPGYGFLAENPDFAKACQDSGIKFIGPTPEVIRLMGDKIEAKNTIAQAHVPVIPGYNGIKQDLSTLIKEGKKIGFPLLVKATAGGGGKGMRIVHAESELEQSIESAKREAKSAFGNDSVFLEQYIDKPRHIEFQILADKHGHVIHLFERECSVQRRHQKIVEETPSPLITPDVRKAMGEAAVAAAKAVDYSGAGTIEFIVDDQQHYYFLEMNTRLQVEHPITERVVGADLVKEMIRIAQGDVLWLKQEDLYQDGHAIECRIYAEDPDNNFMPSPGRIAHITEPKGLGVRCDGYIYEGYEIPIYYDPMISKLICWSRTREGAIARMKRALYEYKITGVKTNIRFLERIMDCPAFNQGHYNTQFIEKNQECLTGPRENNPVNEDRAIMVIFADYLSKLEKFETKVITKEGTADWKVTGRKKNLYN